jgi:hypothetical protein
MAANIKIKNSSIRRFLYFGGHFGFKMDAIANRSGRNVVQHILLTVNIHLSARNWMKLNRIVVWHVYKWC